MHAIDSVSVKAHMRGPTFTRLKICHESHNGGKIHLGSHWTTRLADSVGSEVNRLVSIKRSDPMQIIYDIMLQFRMLLESQQKD